MRTLEDVISLNMLAMPIHKVAHVVSHREYVEAMWETLTKHMDFPRTQKTLDTLKTVVEEYLVGSKDVEYEWTEEQYNAFVLFEPELDK